MFADSPDFTRARAFTTGFARAAALTGLAIALATPAGAEGTPDVAHGGKPRGNAVTHWNAVATDAFPPSQGTNPMAQSRTLAILHAAIHDAINAIDQRFESYTPGIAEAPEASVDAAVAAAARDVLVGLVPDQSALVEAAPSFFVRLCVSSQLGIAKGGYALRKCRDGSNA